MTENSDYFAEPPSSAEWQASSPEAEDALSEILHVVQLQGRSVARYASRAPFNIALPAGTRWFHIVEQGPIRIQALGMPTQLLDAGDLVLCARGDGHHLQAGDPISARTLRDTDSPPNAALLSDARAPRWLTGTFTANDTIADPVFSVLPSAIVVSSQPHGQEWLPVTLQLLLVEVTSPSPGSSAMISRLLDLLFIHALREWSRQQPTNAGWLTAAMDPALSTVLTAIHRDLSYPWSVAQLATIANVSRTAMAQRFTRLLGRPPLTYIADRRLSHAAELLRTSTTPVAAIANQVGYSSEAAFSRAFRRRYGQPPRQWKNATESLRDKI
ncbi:AraC family transcriptional regulator [Mycolicibacterium helvum]|uniref:Putative transcriptional regulator, AraC family protein n=1 Tax=Mycolicibacterium helvum TaxID=1534349 RepID=A0A7I7T0Z9_9MYCO|nr:AraC family transcriptional regulator [Mycolicibacterium helvum]BBY62129.1 putative transcriptional regulator, AraC family protein [Mycolicibacterium helvum]